MSTRNNTLLGILAGSIAGLTAGILFAPDKGSNTRRKIKETANEASDKVSSAVNDFTDEINIRFRSKKAEFENELDSLVSDMHIKADDAIVSLEKKLETLRKRNETINAN